MSGRSDDYLKRREAIWERRLAAPPRTLFDTHPELTPAQRLALKDLIFKRAMVGPVAMVLAIGSQYFSMNGWLALIMFLAGAVIAVIGSMKIDYLGYDPNRHWFSPLQAMFGSIGLLLWAPWRRDEDPR